MTPERNVKNKINDYIKSLQKQKIKIYSEPRIVGGYTYKKGVPDIWVVLNGRHIEFEIKREDGGILSTMQLQYQKYFTDLGIPCYTVNSLDEFKEILKKEGLDV